MTEGRHLKKRSMQTAPSKGRWQRIGLYTFLAVFYAYVSTSILLFHGPFTTLRSFFIQSVDTSMHGYLLRPLSLWTISNAEIKKYQAKLISVAPAKKLAKLVDYSGDTNNKIVVDTIHESTFSAKIMYIYNPLRVKVAVTKYIGQQGETVSEFVQSTNAVAGINAGAFEETDHWRGTGGEPLGITMHNSQLVNNDQSQWSSQPVVGLTNKGQLIAGGYSIAQLKDMGVTESVSFGPVLIQDGQPIHGINTWGVAPRTAIGQLANGTIVFVVTDGRAVNGPNDLGASIAQLRDLMLKLGCVTAVNLDGGSSATMIYNGKLINTPTDVLGERKVATAFVVMPQ